MFYSIMSNPLPSLKVENIDLSFCQVNFAYFKETLKKTKRKKDKDDDEEMDSEDEEDPFRLVVL